MTSQAKNSEQGLRRRRKDAPGVEPVVHETFGLDLTEPIDVEVRRTAHGNVVKTPLLKWCEWEFPVPGKRKKLQIIDVNGVGRLWNATDLNSWGQEYLRQEDKAGPRKLSLGQQVQRFSSLTWTKWVLGLADPLKHIIKVHPEGKGLYPFVTNHAAMIYFGSVIRRLFFRDEKSWCYRNKLWVDQQMGHFRVARHKAMIQRFYGLIDSLPPEWTLMVKTGAVDITAQKSPYRIVRLAEKYRYVASLEEPSE